SRRISRTTGSERRRTDFGSACVLVEDGASWPGAAARAAPTFPPDRGTGSMIVVSKVSSVQPSGTADRAGSVLGGNADGLRRASEFSDVLQQGARLTGERMLVYIMPRDQGLRVG